MLQNEMPLVSVIVPVYNVQEYLVACVASICRQNYNKLEILLIDDGSTDESGKICDSYLTQDSRIIVIHKENGGVSDARNVGISNASGEYICFVDPDDLVSENYVRCMLEQCEENNADMAVMDAILFEDRLPKVKNSWYETEIWTEKECIREMLLADKCGHAAYGKIFKREMWTNFRFPKGQIYEDYSTIYKVVAQGCKVIYINVPMYFYRKRSGSIMNSVINEKKLSIIDISQKVTQFICEYSDDLRIYAIYRQLVIYMKALDEIIEYDSKKWTEYQTRIVETVTNNKEILNCPFVRKSDKIKMKSLLINENIFKILYKIGNRVNWIKLKVAR